MMRRDVSNKTEKPEEIKALLLAIINDSESNLLAALNENDIMELATGLSDDMNVYYKSIIKELVEVWEYMVRFAYVSDNDTYEKAIKAIAHAKEALK